MMQDCSFIIQTCVPEKASLENLPKTYLKLMVLYEGHSVNSEIRCASAIAYLLAESKCCLYKAPTFISHNTKETIS